MTKQIVADLLLDLAALICFTLLIYTGKLTAGEGLPPLLLILGIKAGVGFKSAGNGKGGGSSKGGVSTMLAVLAAASVATATVDATTDVDEVDESGEHGAQR